jgi:2,4-dienoyl-CoA reductase (NADPH2)
MGGTDYVQIDRHGLHVTTSDGPALIECDTVVLCAGQEPERRLQSALEGRGVEVHVIGGADVAAELDAKRAIDQGARLAAGL